MQFLLTLFMETDGVDDVLVVEAIPSLHLFAPENHERLGAVVASMASMALLEAAELPYDGARCASA